MKIITQEEAKARGLMRYFTSEPCKHGHIAPRRVVNKGCCECHRINSKKYNQNPVNKERRNLQWQKRRAQSLEMARNYYYENREKVLTQIKGRQHKIRDLLAVLQTEMPDLLKEFGL